MLIVFAATRGGTEAPPDLRDLHVKDSDSGVDVPVAGLDGWDNDFMQSEILTFAPCQFTDEKSFTGQGDTDKMWCRRLSKGLSHVTFSSSGANVSLRPLWYDKNGVETIGATTTVTATSRQDGDSHYIAPVFEFNLNGANQCAVEIVSISAGTAYVRLAGV